MGGGGSGSMRELFESRNSFGVESWEAPEHSKAVICSGRMFSIDVTSVTVSTSNCPTLEWRI